MVKEVAWIVGSSAAGKETFISNIMAKPPHDITKQLGWEGRTVATSQASIDHLGEKSSRDKIIEEMPGLFERADIVAVKWQGADSRADPNRVKALRDQHPDALHRVIHLVADDDEAKTKRLRQKPWWNPEDDAAQFVSRERLTVQRYVDELRGEFPIVRIDSNTLSYKVIEPPYSPGR